MQYCGLTAENRGPCISLTKAQKNELQLLATLLKRCWLHYPSTVSKLITCLLTLKASERHAVMLNDCIYNSQHYHHYCCLLKPHHIRQY